MTSGSPSSVVYHLTCYHFASDLSLESPFDYDYLKETLFKHITIQQ